MMSENSEGLQSVSTPNTCSGLCLRSESVLSLGRGDIWEAYEKGACLGSGGFGCCYRAKDRLSGQQVCIKIIHDGRAAANAKEFEMLRDLSHPHIMRVIQYYIEGCTLSIVSELAARGDLTRYFAKHHQGALTASFVAGCLCQLVGALAYCHNKNITHHDIKPANVLVTDSITPAGLPHLLIADFGCSQVTRCRPGTSESTLRRVTSVTGTPIWMPPEALHLGGRSTADEDIRITVGHKTDVYSLGLLAFWMLSGGEEPTGPGESPDLKHLRPLDRGTDEGSSLVEWMTQRQYDNRPTCKEISTHPFMQFGCDASPVRDNLKCELSQRLVERSRLSFLQRSALHLLVAHFTEEQLSQSRSVFESLDSDKGGTLSLEELQRGFADRGWDSAVASEIFRSVDIHCQGEVEFSEWAAACVNFQRITPNQMQALGRRLFFELAGDKNVISWADLKKRFQYMSETALNDLHEEFLQLEHAAVAGRVEGNSEEAEEMDIDSFFVLFGCKYDKNWGASAVQTVERPISVTPQSEPDEYNEVNKILRKLLSEHKDSNSGLLRSCLETLRAYLKNLVNNPGEEKFRKINKKNNAFCSRIVPIEGAESLLLSVGFAEHDGDLLVIEPPINSTQVNTLLKKIDATLTLV